VLQGVRVRRRKARAGRTQTQNGKKQGRNAPFFSPETLLYRSHPAGAEAGAPCGTPTRPADKPAGPRPKKVRRGGAAVVCDGKPQQKQQFIVQIGGTLAVSVFFLSS